MADAPTAEKKAPLKDILAYSMGDGANSLVMNTFYGFAMLYYTKALGMSGTQSGLAAFITTMWDAITDPLM
ncbi:MAG: sodium:melibiose symporter, partial [Planctomycetes bacterium]|nr:sodium:melibiose symporter [Planctomycetota bacterium]